MTFGAYCYLCGERIEGTVDTAGGAVPLIDKHFRERHGIPLPTAGWSISIRDGSVRAVTTERTN